MMAFWGVTEEYISKWVWERLELASSTVRVGSETVFFIFPFSQLGPKRPEGRSCCISEALRRVRFTFVIFL